MKTLMRFVREEEGLGTVEMLLILAGLVSVALIFKKQLVGFVKKTLGTVFGGAESGAVIEN